MKFADTSWWVAYLNTADGRHETAIAMSDAIGSGEHLLTTNHVLGELWTFASKRLGHDASTRMIDQILRMVGDGRVKVHRLDRNAEEQSWTWLRRHDERVYSFVDATSFQVMRDRRVREVLTFDGDFVAAGFVEVRPN